MSTAVRTFLSLTMTGLGSLLIALGCGENEVAALGACGADVPEGWTCTSSLAIDQSECQADALGSDVEPTVTATEQGVMISGANFRCAQDVCAYLDDSVEPARLLLQPCDMEPETVAKCVCLYGLEVDVDVPASGLDVYSRYDSIGGEQEPQLVGHVTTAEDVVAQRLCDGSDKLRFATQNAGGNLTGVPRVAQELGWSFLLIDGQCNYWASAGGEVRTGVLTPDQEEEFSEALLLGRWSELARDNPNCADASSLGYRYYDERFSISCATNELTAASGDWRVRLFDAGTPLDGPVRYSLTDADAYSAWQRSTPEIAQSWTLDWDPATRTVGQGEDEQAEPNVASGSEADSLRALRANYEAPENGLGPWLRIPIVYESEGTEARYFDLALRDVTPFEIDGRLDVDAFFE